MTTILFNIYKTKQYINNFILRFIFKDKYIEKHCVDPDMNLLN